MTKLDETGLAAATREAASRRLGYPTQDGFSSVDEVDIAAVITAYLAAVRTSDALRDLQRLGQECETPDVRGALQRLVELKDGPRDAVYSCTKAAVWQAARDALAHNPVPKGGQDRLAVVSQLDGKAFGATFQNGTADEQCARLERLLMMDANAKGPFRRQIVTIPGGLLRPEPVGEVVGSVEDA